MSNRVPDPNMISPGPHRGSAPPNDGMSAVQVVFPRDEEEFKADTRVSYDSLNQKWILEDDDGREYEWNSSFKQWVESMDEALLEQQRSAYKIEGVDENEPAAPSKKRKTGDEDNTGSKKQKKAPVEFVNSSIYITNLPLDTDKDEIHDAFKKYGMISKGIDTGEPRISMYANEDGSFKGDALVIYFRPESVDQALYLADGIDIRTGGSGPTRVREADTSYKKQKEVTAEQIDEKRSKRKSNKEREKIKAMTNAMNARLADWDDDDPQTLETDLKPKNKWNNCVMIKHMFNAEVVKKDRQELIDIEGDLREEAQEKGWGTIQKINMYDLEPEGLVQIRFTNSEDAEKAKNGMDGRFFDGKQLEAWVQDKKEKYRMSDYEEIDDPDEAEEARVKAFGKDTDAVHGEDPKQNVQDGGLKRNG